jgi:hypothetical protein
MDALPTVSPGTLEAVRTDGDLRATPDEADGVALVTETKARGWKRAFAWFKICDDDTGAITGTHARESSSPLAERTFASAIARWKFGPPKLGDHAVPVCANYRFVHPPTEDPEVLPMAFPLAEGRACSARSAGADRWRDRDHSRRPQQGCHDTQRDRNARRFVPVLHRSQRQGARRRDGRINTTRSSWRACSSGATSRLVGGKSVVACTSAVFVYSQR